MSPVNGCHSKPKPPSTPGPVMTTTAPTTLEGKWDVENIYAYHNCIIIVEKACSQPLHLFAGDYLMVIGGRNDEGVLSNIEVVSLQNEDVSCNPQHLP